MEVGSMSEQRINIGNGQKDKIVTREMKIAKNVFIYNDSFIPLQSISQVSVIKEQEKPYSLKALFAIVVGFILFFLDGVLTFIGLGIMACAGYVLYITYKYNTDIGEYLKIDMNSGKSLYFYNKNHKFLIEIMDVMVNCINTKKEYLVSMDTYNIKSCQFGNDNLMTNERSEDEDFI